MIAESSYQHLDRNRTPLCSGQIVKIMHCTGPYGQVEIVVGELLEIDEHHGLRIRLEHDHEARSSRKPTHFLKAGDDFYVASVFRASGDGILVGYRRHEDFEHEHEEWIEVQAVIKF